jgi:hypothetical protein
MKPWYTSKTLYANLIAGGVTIAGVFGVDVGLDPEAQAQLVAGVMVVVNIALRLITNQGLEK